LYENQFREYLIEAEKFRQEFGKNVKCDVCSDWQCDLYFFKDQTYCQKHMPPELQRENERKIRAWNHGSSRDYIKK
jgi:hypothetical protein